IEYNCTQKRVQALYELFYLTKSRIRQALLTLFFTNPSNRYYLRELERILGHSAGSIRRELLKFTKDDLFHTRRAGNLLYYYLNTEHPLYEEIKNIVSKTVGVEGRLRKALSTIKEIDVAFIYGSFASGNEKSTSDVDLMLIGDPEISFLNEKIAQLEKILQREINISVYSSEEYMRRKRENSGFVMDVLNNPKIMLIGKEDDL
ncbi:MAG TPA: nucleotidyltransferase domain-containing protein, partial [Spirochaetota bacterium]|nr:nucleotidyltransferase domain-containing protein [Spirochaetota bacterium]